MSNETYERIKKISDTLPLRCWIQSHHYLVMSCRTISPAKIYYVFLHKGANWTSQSFLRQSTMKTVQAVQVKWMWICGPHCSTLWNTLWELMGQKLDEIEASYWSRAQKWGLSLVKRIESPIRVNVDLWPFFQQPVKHPVRISVGPNRSLPFGQKLRFWAFVVPVQKLIASMT